MELWNMPAAPGKSLPFSLAPSFSSSCPEGLDLVNTCCFVHRNLKDQSLFFKEYKMIGTNSTRLSGDLENKHLNYFPLPSFYKASVQIGAQGGWAQHAAGTGCLWSSFICWPLTSPWSTVIGRGWSTEPWAVLDWLFWDHICRTLLHDRMESVWRAEGRREQDWNIKQNAQVV